MKKISIAVILLLLIQLTFYIEVSQSQDILDNITIETSSNLPDKFSWRDINGVDFTTPIRNQAPLPSCETFAIVAAVETMVQYKVGYPFGCDLSEAHLYYYSGGNVDWGSYPENDTNFLKEYGVPDEACWPYPNVSLQYPLNTTAPNWKNRTVKITDWRYLPEDINAIKTALINNGPVPTYFQVFKDFPSYDGGIYRHRWGKFSGIHYVCIVGYNDNPGYWICKNSWGTHYSDEGWFKIAYGECSIEKKSFYLEDVYGQFPIIYVDDDNTNGPWDGSIEHPYQNIQHGINNAYKDWTVYVKNGVYDEKIIINKTINLNGENKSFTIINGDGTGHVVTITKPHVKISGFTIQNSGTNPFEAGIKTLFLSSNATIENNIVQNNEIGIFLNYAYTEQYDKTSWNVVNDNIIQNNNDGLYIHWSDNIEVSRNLFYRNNDDGIEVESSRNSIFQNNIFQENGNHGLYLRAASNRNTIRNNDFIDNEKQVYFDGSLFNSWRGNYWSDSIWILIKPIKGQIDIYDIPWIAFDILPSLRLNN
jgi:parallel beta-helix repeat protein